MSVDTALMDTAGYSGKRLIDIVLVLLLAFPALIICALCALAIWMECHADPLFVQIRIGHDEKPFRLIKLRTMAPNTANLPSHEVGANQLLQTGKLFRAVKLDELPQIWNVFMGEMSFVGPRPCLPTQQELRKERRERSVYKLRPGITGPAQLAGIDMSTPCKLAEADSSYLETNSLSGDLQMLLKTFTGGGSGDAIKD